MSSSKAEDHFICPDCEEAPVLLGIGFCAPCAIARREESDDA